LHGFRHALFRIAVFAFVRDDDFFLGMLQNSETWSLKLLALNLQRSLKSNDLADIL